MMPSLLKYFVITGGALLGLLFVANAVFEPGGPGPRLVRAEVPKTAVKLDPQASKVERLRAEETAEKAAKAAAAAAAAAEAEAQLVVTEPPMPVRQAAAPVPAQVSAPAALTTSAPTEDEASRATRLAQEKIKADKAKAKKARLARERAKAKALEEASAQQAAPQTYGYAPRPAYGPFGQGGGWQGQRW